MSHIEIINTLSNFTNCNINSTTKNCPSVTKLNSCSDTNSSNLYENCKLITPDEFENLISFNFNTNQSQSIPIIDCRSQIDFGSERIRSAKNINCKAKLIAKKLISRPVEEIEPSLAPLLKSSDSVILYDESTNVRAIEKLSSLPINLVIKAVKRSNKYIFIIQGGFSAVQKQFPHLIECAIDRQIDQNDQDNIPSTPQSINKENLTMTEIVPHIFVGNLLDAQTPERLEKNGITHIINSTVDLPFYYENKYEHIRVDVFDLPSQNIRRHFETVCQFIDEALCVNTNNVLVHCSAGISRSPTLVLAYMIKKDRMKLDDAFRKMRQLRPIVDPNVSFILQLRDWETKCLTNETNDDNINLNCSSVRSTSNPYCGSSSKSKSDKKSCTDSAITVK